MTKKILEILILLVFLSAFFLEGSSINYGRDIAYLLILCLPVLLYLLCYARKIDIKYPKKLLILLLILIVFQLISLITSVNVENSFKGMTVLISYFFIFFYTYLNKDIFEKYFLKYLNIAICVFVAIFPVVNLLYTKKLPFIDYANNYQYIYSPSGLHYHLGDLLLIPLISSFYFFINKKQKKYLLPIVILLPIFILSFSRSGYLSFLVMGFCLLIYYFKDNWLKFYHSNILGASLLFIVVLTIIPFFLFGVSINIGDFKYEVNLYAKNKTIIGSREKYFGAGFKTIQQHPLFGIGLRNFIYGYEKNREVTITEVTGSSHNIFIDILVGNGILGFLIFVAIFFIFFKKTKKNIYFFLCLTLLANFQTDYTFQIYSFLLLLFVFAGMCYEDNEFIVNNNASLISAILFLISMFIILSNIFYYFGNYKLSQTFFPLDRDKNKTLITQYIADKDYKNALDLMEYNHKIHSLDLNTLYFNLNIYEMFKNDKMIINYHKYICNASNILDCYNNLYTIYSLDKNELLKGDLKSMLKDFFIEWEKFGFSLLANQKTGVYSKRNYVYYFCQKLYLNNCPYRLNIK